MPRPRLRRRRRPLTFLHRAGGAVAIATLAFGARASAGDPAPERGPPPAVVAQRVLVLDERGEPVEGVPVDARRVSDDAVDVADLADVADDATSLEGDVRGAIPPARPPVVVASARTGADGLCTLENLVPGAPCEFVARPRPPHVGSRLVRLLAPPNGGTVLLPAARGAPLSLVATDEQGRPIAAEATVARAGAWARTRGRDADETIGAWHAPWSPTDAGGRLTWDAVPTGAVEVRVRVRGRGVVVRRVVTPADGAVTVPLGPDGDPGRVLARAVDTAGAPIAGARVALEWTGAGVVPSRGLHVVTTDARGEARLERVGGARVRVRFVESAGRVGAARVRVPADAGHGDVWPEGDVAVGGEVVLAVRLARAGRVEGIVRDETGAPVAGARVRLATRLPWVSWRTTSDGSGAYAFDALPPLVGQLGAAGDGWIGVAPASMVPLDLERGPGVPVAIRPDEGRVVRRDLRVRRAPAPPPLALEGRVVTTDGHPVAGAWVEYHLGAFERGERVPPRYTRADAEGRYRISQGLRPGGWQVRAITEDGESYADYVVVGGADVPAPTSLELRVGAPVAGTVRDAEWRPRPGVVVTPVREPNGLRGAYRGPVRDQPSTVTDARGGFAFRGAPSLVAFEWGDGEMRFEPLFGRKDLDYPNPLRVYTWFRPPTDAADLRCPDVGAIDGVVRDADGKPLRGAVVRFELLDGEQRRRRGRARIAWSDAAGAFRASTLVVGTYEATVEGRDVEGAWPTGTKGAVLVARTEPPAPSEVPEAAPSGATCVGRVVDAEGRGVTGALVTLVRHGAEVAVAQEPLDVTDDDGRFRLTYGTELDEIRVFPGDGWCPPAPVARGDDRSPVVVRLARGARLAGIVRTPQGLPARGATVYVVPSGGGAKEQRLVVGDDGAFEAVVPADAGPFVVEAYEDADASEHAPAGAVAGVAGGTIGTVVPMRAPVEFMPVVVRADGSPAVGARVVLSALDVPTPRPRDLETTVFRPDGVAWFVRVRPGRHRVVAIGADGEGGRPEGFVVDVPASVPPRLVLRAAAAVRWTIAGPPPTGQRAHWRALVGAAAPLVRTLSVAADGTLEGALPPGLRGTLLVNDGRDDRFVLARDVGADAPPHALAWGEGKAIAGRVEGFERGTKGFTVVAVGSDVRAEAAIRADGTFEVRGLPPGAYRVRVSQDARSGGDPTAGLFRLHFADPPIEEWALVSAGTRDVVLPVGPHVVVERK